MKARPSPRAGFRLFALLMLLAAGSVVSAQPTFFEPKEGYYKARGTRVTAAWSVDRTTQPENETLTATLTIRGATNPQEIVRPDLRKLKEFTDRFRSIVDVPGPAVTPTADEVAFVYKLQVRDRSVKRLPSLDFFYLNSAIKTGDPFQNARARGIDLTITEPPPKPKPPPVPMSEPDSLFEVTTGPASLGREPFHPGLWVWLGALVLGPLLALAWYVVWRRIYPDAIRLARLRRSRAARRAIDVIRKAGRTADPAGAIAGAVRGYLRARFPLSSAAETPSEIEHELRLAGLQEAEADSTTEFFRRADAARFAPPTDISLSLANEAEALITRLEAVE